MASGVEAEEVVTSIAKVNSDSRGLLGNNPSCGAQEFHGDDGHSLVMQVAHATDTVA